MDRSKHFRTSGFRAFSLLPLALLVSLPFDPSVSAESALLWENTVRWMEAELPLLQHGCLLIIYYWVAALLPMCIFPRMRPLIATTLRASSWLVGGACWWHSFIVTFRLLGWLSALLGVLCAGLGVVPMAILATAARSQWDVFGNLLAAVALTIIPRIVANFLTHRTVNAGLAGAAKSHYSDDYEG